MPCAHADLHLWQLWHVPCASDLAPHALLQVPANLGKEGYLSDIAKATDDIDVQLIFCNAGYLLTGFFHNRRAFGQHAIVEGQAAHC